MNQRKLASFKPYNPLRSCQTSSCCLYSAGGLTYTFLSSFFPWRNAAVTSTVFTFHWFVAANANKVFTVALSTVGLSVLMEWSSFSWSPLTQSRALTAPAPFPSGVSFLVITQVESNFLNLGSSLTIVKVPMSSRFLISLSMASTTSGSVHSLLATFVPMYTFSSAVCMSLPQVRPSCPEPMSTVFIQTPWIFIFWLRRSNFTALSFIHCFPRMNGSGPGTTCTSVGVGFPFNTRSNLKTSLALLTLLCPPNLNSLSDCSVCGGRHPASFILLYRSSRVSVPMTLYLLPVSMMMWLLCSWPEYITCSGASPFSGASS